MKSIAFSLACLIGLASGAQAADLLSGTWTAGDGPETRVYVFKVVGDTFTGIVCGPCDNPANVYRIEEGRVVGADRASFFIRRDGGRRERVEATVARNLLTLSAGASGPLRRVVENFEVENFELSAASQPEPPAGGDASKAAAVAGRWVSPGRVAQQNWILNVDGNSVWGLVCGPCTPQVVAMIDGHIDGDTIRFYINHIDTPPSPNRQGIRRNIMTAKLPVPGNGNLMRFNWVSEQTPTNTGEIVMIGPLR
jgi:hypothetical protein